MHRPRWLVTVAALGSSALAAGAAPTGAPAQEPDRGTTRVVATDGGLTAKSWTTDDGRMRCIDVAPLGSSCAPSGLKEGALFIAHAVGAEASRAPRLGRLVIAGLAGSRAVRVRVRWGGGVRTARPGRFGAYLVVLPARTRQRDVVITARYADGTSATTDYRASRPRVRPVPGSERVEQRLDDPLSPRPLALLTWRAARGLTCLHIGDLVGERVGALRGRTFVEYPVNDGGTCFVANADPLAPPIGYGIASGRGRMVVSGFVRPDVRAVELELRDGTLRPLAVSGRRVVAAALASTSLEDRPATALVATLADGSRVRQPLG